MNHKTAKRYMRNAPTYSLPNVTVDDVNRFFDENTKTPAEVDRLLHRIGVRFTKGGKFSHVVPV